MSTKEEGSQICNRKKSAAIGRVRDLNIVLAGMYSIRGYPR